jgi:hypothetical protein
MKEAEYLADMRRHFAVQLSQAVRDTIAAIIVTEVGAMSAARVPTVARIFNNANRKGTTLAAQMTPAFYGPMRTGAFQKALAHLTAVQRRTADRAIDKVMAGEGGFFTDQGAASEIAGQATNIGGEYFGHLSGGARWEAKHRAKMAKDIPFT